MADDDRTSEQGSATNRKALSLDYRKGVIPAWVNEVIQTHLAIEQEDAKSAGQLGYMARALVLATMPYKDPKTDAFTRTNGDFKLRIVAGYEGGIPYGIYPRLLMSWVTTEAARNKSPEIELGESLAKFMRDVLEIKPGHGKRGSSTRVSEQMKRLFGSMMTVQYTGKLGQSQNGFSLRNVMIAESLDLGDNFDDIIERTSDAHDAPPPPAIKHASDDADDVTHELWTPQSVDEAGQWKSRLRLTDQFFRECIARPVPIDLRAYKALRGSPLAMDAYTWLTYRLSYTQKATKPIPWLALTGQFGSNFTGPRALIDFRRDFLKALKLVSLVYPQANYEATSQGIILLPSDPHIPKVKSRQPTGLF